MKPLLPLLMLAVFFGAWHWFLHRASRGRMWSPLWMAFSTTAVAVLFMGAGTIGYALGQQTRFAEGTRWSENVIWWQVGVGLALVPLAAFLWRKGLRSLATNSHPRL
jgi:hypothetical protein